VEKSLDEFYTHARTKDGKGSWCKKCLMAKTAEKRKDPIHKELWKEYGRRSLLKKRYGITADQYDQMEQDQEGVCAICKVKTNGGRNTNSRLAVDHNHTTGVVRGLLCSMCNQGIGMFKEDAEIMLTAITYLKSYESSQSSSSSSRACLS
jgi:hypothetical protein